MTEQTRSTRRLSRRALVVGLGVSGAGLLVLGGAGCQRAPDVTVSAVPLSLDREERLADQCDRPALSALPICPDACPPDCCPAK